MKRRDVRAVEVKVSVAEDYLDRVDQVAARLAAVGMGTQQVLRRLGVITGTASRATWPTLRTIEGVSKVTASRDVQLSPPSERLR